MINPSQILLALQTAAGVVHRAGQLPLQSQLLEAHQTVLDLFATQAGLTLEKAALVQRVSELETLLRLRDDFEHHHNAYWTSGAGPIEGPFCSTCFDADGKAIRLIQLQESAGKCGVCSNRVSWAGFDQSDSAPHRRIQGPSWVHGWRK